MYIYIYINICYHPEDASERETQEHDPVEQIQAACHWWEPRLYIYIYININIWYIYIYIYIYISTRVDGSMVIISSRSDCSWAYSVLIYTYIYIYIYIMCISIYILHIPPNGEWAPKAEGIYNTFEPVHEDSSRNYTGDARAHRPANLSVDGDGEAVVTTIHAFSLLL